MIIGQVILLNGKQMKHYYSDKGVTLIRKETGEEVLFGDDEMEENYTYEETENLVYIAPIQESIPLENLIEVVTEQYTDTQVQNAPIPPDNVSRETVVE